MKVTCALAMLGLSCGMALADEDAAFVSGTWTGTGVLQMEDRIDACSEVQMRFAGTATSYRFLGASLTCGGKHQDIPDAGSYEIRPGGQIHFRDVKVGLVGNGRIHIDNPVAVANGMSDDYTVIRRGDVLIFAETMARPATTPWFSFVSIMKKDPGPAGR
ncbi:conserved exported protein of unknown function [Rhodovastum atsumiense]|uniref:DUF3617 family protein n=1 Tax=Rhodovastum atsumiense TaxID=504468 RepID=A0A5M6IM09_9PROT|nr:hypothetical protein [Rhodovastum atsumiense]KAA5609252.1 hypothetical protein F1189_25070 [Rhodovastum atsumiense]CAH2601705.1 conserved exported protein of unknown function [Rhodovastum atsumiense]